MDEPARVGTDRASDARPTLTGRLPVISDYWPDAPHRIAPSADSRHRWEHEALPIAPVTSQANGRSTDRTGKRKQVVVLLVVAMLAATGIVVTTLMRSGDTRPPAATEAPMPNLPPAGPAYPGGTSAVVPLPTVTPTPATVTPAKKKADAHAVSAPANGLSAATFDLAGDTAAANVRSAALGDDLFRITTPASSGVLPHAAVHGAAVRLTLSRVADDGPSAVDVILNANVRWTVRLTGGLSRASLDLRGVTLTAVELFGDAASIDLRVPRPDGTLPVRINGGVNQLRLTTTGGVPVRVRARGGAGTVVLNGRAHNGVASGSTFTSGAFGAGGDRIDVDVTVGIGSVIAADG